ncbi:alanine racemase [Flavobacterium dauae]|uniref:alanine racemase n=1 Tax=Flavobacterium dauae TaxID=1563479 RepID=UPI00101BEDFA|nr:alanine racemase [Flavobacterium dauae]WLD24263.1 alanine racemase [Flavobacterium dauae]
MNITKNNSHLLLTPLLHSWVKKLIDNPESLHTAIEQYNSPLNVHSLIPFQENITEYQQVFKELNLKHKIFFARKANKCIAFPITAAQAGEGADTASYRELKQCLDAGISPKDLILTAAVKNEKLLSLAVDNQVTVVLDNFDEWELLKKIVNEKQKKVTVNIRLSGFNFEGKILHTRFGFSLNESFELIQQIHNQERFVNFTGLHFHLNGYSVEQRVAAIEQSIQLVDRLQKLNIITQSLDIGGGYLMNYLADESEWKKFNQELKRAVLEERNPLTYQNDALGIIKINDRLYGEPTVYPYFNHLHKSNLLRTILTAAASIYQQPIFQLLQQRNIELRMEPGRSLLDQCGITVAKVAFRKKDTAGNWLFGLEMNRTQLRSSSADFLLDPVHIPKVKNNENNPVEGFLVGAYCLEQELILKRKIAFVQFPQVGDLIIFPNTAGYMMHFFESEAHLFELATNVILKNNHHFVIDN